MPEETLNHDLAEVALPALLRFARKTYGAAMRTTLSTAGYDDIPSNGMYILGAMARTAQPPEHIARQVGIAQDKQEALLNALRESGYLAPTNGSFELTERGKQAAAVSRAAVEVVDSELQQEVGNQVKSVLAVLIDIHDRRHGLPRGRR